MSENRNKNIISIMNKTKEKQKDALRRTSIRRTEVIKKEPPTEKPKGEVSNLLAQIKAKTNTDAGSSVKKSIKEDYLELAKNRIQAGNILIKDVSNSIKEEYAKLVKEELPLSLDKFSSPKEKTETTLKIKRTIKQMELVKNQLVEYVGRDLSEHFSIMYHEVEGMQEDKMEVIKKIKFEKDKIIYTTEEGVYEFDGIEASNFGGFITLKTQIATETISIDTIIKNLNKGKTAKAKSQSLMWLLITPIIAPTREGKVLVMPMDYLKKALKYYIDSFESTNKIKAKVKEGMKASPRYGYSESEEHLHEEIMDTKREAVRKLATLSKPNTFQMVTYPYHLLEASGVEFEMDYKELSTKFVNNTIESEGFISWDKLEEAMKVNRIQRVIDKINDWKIKGTDIDYPEVFRKLEYLIENNLIKKDYNIINAISYDWVEDTKTKNSWKNLEENTHEIIKTFDRIENNYKTFIELSMELGFSDRNILLYWDRLESAIKRIEDSQRDYNNDGFMLMVGTIQGIIPAGWVDSETLSQGLTETKQAWRSKVNRKEEIKKEITKARKDYVRRREEVLAISKAIGVKSNLKFQNLSVPLTLGEYKMDLNNLIIEKLFELNPSLEESFDRISKYTLPVPKPTPVDYRKVTAMVRFFKGREEEVHWYDALKILLSSSSFEGTHIRAWDDIKELVSVEELKENMVELNRKKKFYTPQVEPETEEQKRFNTLIGKIAKDRRGLISGINFRKLIQYIVDTKEPITGDDLIKYIPSVSLIEGYFHISESSVIYPPLLAERLVHEIPNLPPTYIALNKILDTCTSELEERRGELEKHLDIIREYSGLTTDIKDTVVREKVDEQLKKGKEGIDTLNSRIESELDPVTKETLIEEKSKALLKLSNQKRDIMKEQDSKLSELSGEVKEVKDKLEGLIGSIITNVVERTNKHYQLDRAKRNVIKAWEMLGFTKFRVGRVLLVYVNDLVKGKPEIVQAAIMDIIKDYCLELKVNTDGTTLPKEQVIRYNFETIAFTLQMDGVLKLGASEILSIINETRQNKDNTEQEQKELKSFIESLEGMDKNQIAVRFRNWEKKELINDKSYVQMAYGDYDFVNMYPDWYSADFDLAENIRIMLELGYPIEELATEIREDSRLMEIVENTEIDLEYIKVRKGEEEVE